ncbi:MAG: hypothetical protein VYB54_04795 [Pseudomonadota bacterium]|nr:hypothetical protein [Pseudomonadota bacterium]
MTLKELHDDLVGWKADRYALVSALDAAVDAHMKRFSAKEREDTKAALHEVIDDAFFEVMDPLLTEIREHETHQRTRQLRADTRDFQRRVL